MEPQVNQEVKVSAIELCVNCFNCKTKKESVYCKFGYFQVKKGAPIIYTPYEFECFSYEEM